MKHFTPFALILIACFVFSLGICLDYRAKMKKLDLIEIEMKDFHGRLCKIEEARK